MILVCELETPMGEIFDGTTPDLRTDDVSFQFRFTDIRQYIIDSRYDGYAKENSTALKLKGIVLIEDLNVSDLSRHFYCFQTFGSNGQVNVAITLNDHVSITIPTPTCASTNQTTTNIPEATPSNTQSPIDSTPNTPTTSEPTNSTRQYSDSTCVVSIVIAAVEGAFIFVLFVIIGILLLILAMLFCSETFRDILWPCSIAKTEQVQPQIDLRTPLSNSPSKEEDAVLETPQPEKK